MHLKHFPDLRRCRLGKNLFRSPRQGQVQHLRGRNRGSRGPPLDRSRLGHHVEDEPHYPFLRNVLLLVSDSGYTL